MPFEYLSEHCVPLMKNRFDNEAITDYAILIKYF